LNSPKAFGENALVHYSPWNLNPFLPIGRRISQIAQKSFEKWQMFACSFSKGFCANPGNGLTNRNCTPN
jgi:hypothetical protein